MMNTLEKKIIACKKCGQAYGNSAIGFGKENKPDILFVGMNPWVENHKFKNGKGITALIEHLSDWKFNDFYFDNVIKCEMPDGGKPTNVHARRCIDYLIKQINILMPKRIIVFGSFAKQHIKNIDLGNIPIIYLPHFSYIYYLGTYNGKTADNYYYELKRIIFEGGKQHDSDRDNKSKKMQNTGGLSL